MDAQYLTKKGWIQTANGWKKYGNGKMPACTFKHAKRVQKVFDIVDEAGINKASNHLIERGEGNVVKVDFMSKKWR